MSYTIINHELIDEETGEVLGPVVAAGTITSETALETVLEKISDAEAWLGALKQKHEAMKAQMEKIEKRKSKYLEYLLEVYQSPIKEYTKTRLEGQKTKTLNTVYGSISFRATKGGVKVTDPEQALQFIEGAGWSHAIKTTSKVLVSELTETEKTMIEQMNATGFEIVQPGENMTIKTVGGSK